MKVHILYAVETAVRDILAAELPGVTIYRGYERDDEQAPAVSMTFPHVVIECSIAEPQSGQWHQQDWRAELNVRVRSKIRDASADTHNDLVEDVFACLASDFTSANVLDHQSTEWLSQSRQIVFDDVVETTQSMNLYCQAK